MAQDSASSSTPPVEQASPSGQAGEEGSKRPEGCTKYFDALWFCYSPVFQMKQYYIYGTVDDCKAHWGRWFNCLKQKTRFRDEEDEAKKGGEHPLWQMRTKDEARAFWQEEFGHLAADEEEEERPRWKTTFF